MARLTGGQALVQQLAIDGLTHIFGVPGVQLDWAVDPLIDLADRIRLLVPRHEQATSYMADGFARTTGKFAACMVVPGPGVLNAMSGLATAYACSSPVVCIAGQIAAHGIGRGYGMLHEVTNQSSILSGVTKYSALARTAEEIPTIAQTAVREAVSGRHRPVAIEVPVDVLQSTVDTNTLARFTAPPPPAPNDADIEAAATLLDGATFPVIWAGGGVIAANASQALQTLAERLNAPVVMSDNGRGALSDRHPLALPSLAGRALLPHADVVLVVGSRFVTLRAQRVMEAPRAKFIYLNIEERDCDVPRVPGHNVIGDARIGLERLASTLGRGSANGPGATACSRVRAWCAQQLEAIQPQIAWLKALRRAIPDDGILINELTQVGYVAPLAYPVFEPRTFITPGYQGTLGYALPTGLGAAIGNPGRVVVAISGDGGFGWNLQELATAAKYQIPLIAVVFNDNAFGNVRRIQQEVFGREIATSLHNPDFIRLADAFGVQGVRVSTPEALERTIIELSRARTPRPALIEVPVDEMPSPWHLLNRFSAPPRPAPPNPLGEPSTPTDQP